ncbi:MAG: FAD binding domain-containing protein [Planctomycetota bacterium]
MYLPEVEFHESTSLEEASSLLSKFGADARLLAGGTELLVDLKSGRRSARHLISLQTISALRGITLTREGLRIGALTTLSELDRHREVRRLFPAIHDATHQMAAVQIRNMATVGGNVVCAVPCADLPPVLGVLGASVRAWSSPRSDNLGHPSGGERTIPIESFFVGVRRTVLKNDEILVSVWVPMSPRSEHSFSVSQSAPLLAKEGLGEVLSEGDFSSGRGATPLNPPLVRGEAKHVQSGDLGHPFPKSGDLGHPTPPAGFGAAYARFSLREGNSVAVAAIAASMRLESDGSIGDARIALGAVSPTPKLVASAREALVGRQPSDRVFAEAAAAAMEQCEPISDVRGSASFRREIVGVLTQRALSTALRRARENGA